MIVVSDTSPLQYLILIKRVELLPTLYGTVFTPPVVIQELSHPHAPPLVRNWAATPPSWLKVQAPQTLLVTTEIDPGEAAAIALAQELGVADILVDDRDAVNYALQHGLDVTGTLGVLILAKNRGLIALREAFRDLQETNFRCSPGLYAEALQKHEPA